MCGVQPCTTVVRPPGVAHGLVRREVESEHAFAVVRRGLKKTKKLTKL